MTEHSEEFIETYERAAKALRENDKETTLQIIKEAREEQINLSAKYRQHTAEANHIVMLSEIKALQLELAAVKEQLRSVKHKRKWLR